MTETTTNAPVPTDGQGFIAAVMAEMEAGGLPNKGTGQELPPPKREAAKPPDLTEPVEAPKAETPPADAAKADAPPAEPARAEEPKPDPAAARMSALKRKEREIQQAQARLDGARKAEGDRVKALEAEVAKLREASDPRARFLQDPRGFLERELGLGADVVPAIAELYSVGKLPPRVEQAASAEEIERRVLAQVEARLRKEQEGAQASRQELRVREQKGIIRTVLDAPENKERFDLLRKFSDIWDPVDEVFDAIHLDWRRQLDEGRQPREMTVAEAAQLLDDEIRRRVGGDAIRKDQGTAQAGPQKRLDGKQGGTEERHGVALTSAHAQRMPDRTDDNLLDEDTESLIEKLITSRRR